MHDDAGARTALAPAPRTVLGSDPHDFAGLYIRHRSSFTSHARRYLRDPRDADEVVQEAFLRLFLAMPELESELQALAYCRRTITNLCIDRYRADARRPRLVTLEGTPVDELAEDDTGDPVVRAEDAALVREALSRLPELHRAALVMREIEEKPLPVIADELDVAEDSVKHLLFRARRGLRKLLAGTSVAPGADAELTRGLRPVARGASGGAAGLLLLALLGLGSGPDLRAVPVVGVDLPDVLGVTAVAEAVSGAVRDVVGAIAPRDEAHAGEPAHDSQRRLDSRAGGPRAAEAPAGAAVDRGAQPTGSTGATPLLGAGAAAPGSSRTTTVVTVVDGRPVVTVVPVAPGSSGQVPAAAAPVLGMPVPGISTGTGPGPFIPTPVQIPGAAGLPAWTPAGPVVPATGATGRPSPSGAPGRSPRADEAVLQAEKAAGRAADKAADAAERSERAADREADKAAAVAERTQDKVDRTSEQAVTKAEQSASKAGQAAAKAEKAAAKSADKAARDRAARAAAERAEDKAAARRAAAERLAAERAAARAAEVAAQRAAELAAQRAAERAAAAAAAAAAQQAAAAAVPVVVTPVAPVPAP